MLWSGPHFPRWYRLPCSLVLLLVAPLLIARAALCAAESERPASSLPNVQLDYQAEPGCPSAADFRRLVARYTARIVWGPSGTFPAHRAAVSVDPKTGEGQLIVAPPDGSPKERTVHGRDCMAVVEALAFALALSMDPRIGITIDTGDVKEPEAPRRVSQRTPSIPEGGDSTGNEGKKEPPPEPPAFKPVSEAPAAARDETSRRPSSARRASLWAGLSVTGETGLNRSLAPGARALLALRFDQRRPPSPFRLAPEARLGAGISFFARGDAAVPVRGRKQVAHIAGCVLSFAPSPKFQILPCAIVELGTLRVVASDLAVSTPRNSFWAALGLDLGAHVLLSFVQLDLQVGLSWNPRTPNFVYGPQEASENLFAPQSLSGRASLGGSVPLF